VAAFLKTVEAMAAGQVDERLPISSRHDELDAIAYGINVLAGELGWLGACAREAQEEKAAELRATVASAEARSSAILTAIPDLMFILLRDGTYVDYHARDPKLLFVPPSAFLGRNVRDVLPPPLAEVMMNALEHACQSDDPVVVEYELPMGEPRSFEARIVRAGAKHLLSIVRDITELKRASELNRDLARQLISSQEVERQRIARELHDDISQRIAALNIEIEQLATQVGSEQSRARVRKLSAQISEIASDVHRMSYELHPSKLQLIGLVAALQSLCSDVSKQRNLHVAFTHGAMPPSIDANVSLCLYRIVQEALQTSRGTATR
jgi:signal transduction histidine kinase